MALYDRVTIRVANVETQQVTITPSNIQEILIVESRGSYRVQIVMTSGRSYFLIDNANKQLFSSLEEATAVINYFITIITDPEISRTVIDQELPEEPLIDHVPSTDLLKIELNKKVNDIPGKGLSSNDFTNLHLVKLNKLIFNGNEYHFLAADGEYRDIGIYMVQALTEDISEADVLSAVALKRELDKKLDKLQNITQTLEGNFDDDIVPSANITKQELFTKVDKIENKQLSDYNYNITAKNKVDKLVTDGESTEFFSADGEYKIIHIDGGDL